ncbi:hypothetical protein FF36_00376 [Frankia torreyi]|uniref:Uncharacterized protein n=1 Tax=Frankia torreyi TaxID=1856 RepID=A0A0D8BLZ7_9ACTN|nr:hypothetical protein FF36_00376 [Frankia torreyi]KQM07941.1 hypothetical protein FF86_1001197 [Frankia sp. CpI1-P]
MLAVACTVAVGLLTVGLADAGALLLQTWGVLLAVVVDRARRR